jgi:hypothetical protein
VIRFSIDIPDSILHYIYYDNLYEYFCDSSHNHMSVCDVLKNISSNIKIIRAKKICDDFSRRTEMVNLNDDAKQFNLLFDFGNGRKENNWYFLNDSTYSSFGQSSTNLVIAYYSYGGGYDEPYEDYINVIHVMDVKDKHIIKTKDGEEIELNNGVFPDDEYYGQF